MDQHCELSPAGFGFKARVVNASPAKSLSNNFESTQSALTKNSITAGIQVAFFSTVEVSEGVRI